MHFHRGSKQTLNTDTANNLEGVSERAAGSGWSVIRENLIIPNSAGGACLLIIKSK